MSIPNLAVLDYAPIPNLAINPAPFRHGVNLTERPQNIQEKVRDKSENDYEWFNSLPTHKRLVIYGPQSIGVSVSVDPFLLLLYILITSPSFLATGPSSSLLPLLIK